MNKVWQFISKSLFLIFVTFLFISCSRVTQTNFDKIKPNMTLQEVVNILGEPSTSDSINIAGVSGTSAVWKDNNKEINIQFLNDKVTIKVFNKQDDDRKH